MSKTICLITPAHISFNPRLVKEADALVDAGYDVTVISCNYIYSVTEFDNEILRYAKWKSVILNWNKKVNPKLFWYSRIRKYISLNVLKFNFLKKYFANNVEFLLRVFDRVLPELRKLVLQHPADLYIAHNLQSLPLAYYAAKKYNSKLGFDAEDFHSGMFSETEANSINKDVVEYFESKFVNKCDYITSASPGISQAYKSKYKLKNVPVSILNVFPLSMSQKKISMNNDEKLKLYWFSQTIGKDRGLNDILEAMGKLKKFNIELHLLGKWQNGFKYEFYQKCDYLGIDKNKIFFYSQTYPNQMVDISSKYDIGLALEPSKDINNSIAISNKIFTYMLAGNAIIATKTKGQQEIADRSGEAIKTYEAGDTNSLASLIKELYLDKKKLKKAKEASLRLGMSNYNWDIEKLKFLELIDSTLS